MLIMLGEINVLANYPLSCLALHRNSWELDLKNMSSELLSESWLSELSTLDFRGQKPTHGSWSMKKVAWPGSVVLMMPGRCLFPSQLSFVYQLYFSRSFFCGTGKMAMGYSESISSLRSYSSSLQRKRRHLSQWLGQRSPWTSHFDQEEGQIGDWPSLSHELRGLRETGSTPPKWWEMEIGGFPMER